MTFYLFAFLFGLFFVLFGEYKLREQRAKDDWEWDKRLDEYKWGKYIRRHTHKNDTLSNIQRLILWHFKTGNLWKSNQKRNIVNYFRFGATHFNKLANELERSSGQGFSGWKVLFFFIILLKKISLVLIFDDEKKNSLIIVCVHIFLRINRGPTFFMRRQKSDIYK